ncbi:hypothetical protein D6745_05070 [Candidatus Woesearchaeota archaeon]|nr:MAG: hypothetical protein D6745_05070 [Candidatus Woesearchaeota archaeon]
MAACNRKNSFRNLIIIGTSHIARQSVREVREFIKNESPDIIALELDRERLSALVSDKGTRLRLADIKKVGVKGFVFAVLGAWIQKKLGRSVGVVPGAEMKEAVKIARKHNIKVALIDQNIRVTLKRFSESLSWKEKWNLLVDIIKAFFGGGEKISVDLRKVPEEKVVKTLIKKVKRRYPNIYKVLIEERNNIMAHRLHNLMVNHPYERIIAVVGAGHAEELLMLVRKAYKQDSNT